MLANLLNTGIILGIFLPLIVLVWTYAIGGPVTTLPYGIHEPVRFFAETIHGIVNTLPWMEVIFDIIRWGLQIKIMLLAYEIFRWIIGIVRGN